MSIPEYHIFTRDGDALAEVDEVLRTLQARGLSAQAAGFHKYLHVTRAGQTVVFLESRQAPLAAALRGRPGWREPGDEALPS
ncbi:MAG TPA: hypothetical protein VFX98_16210 [Longimicrobiaceae bacterium]|nr:hypothetical protein [Longimicrobiaceae bacterium]